jgi:two-component system response regulator
LDGPGDGAVPTASGAAGRSTLKTPDSINGGRPQLVLLDLKMPRMDGLEVLRRIRADAVAADLPVVVLTSSERPEDREAAVAAGATWFVCKPIDGRRFRAEVQQLAERWAVPA